MTKIALTIAGVDPSGGAGTLADVKTFAAFGVFPTAAIGSITFQNTQGVFGAEHQSAESVRQQIIPILDDYAVAAVKTGMLPTREVIEVVAAIIAERSLKNIVVDPVVRSTSGFDLIDDAALRSLIEKLFPLADIVTPNIPEAERISGVAIENESDIHDAASVMRDFGARNVLIKGGHFANAEGGIRRAKDFLFLGPELKVFEGEYWETTATHGTGCTLSSAIAANLALGNDLITSVEIAKRFVNEAIRTAPMIGRGHSPINIKPI
ncbi:MAG: bifunctional hydroxymethylpyrimidine kinase/phosphomethylpyrimidine kinase [bacterium]|nr:bifunctional hydroxymethylpyrimidine kinase/phosphomethylpyrimidine kinase [bacterium]